MSNNKPMKKENYQRVLKTMNYLRQLKIDALHELKKSKALSKYMPQSAYSHAINGIKAGIREDDKTIAEFKRQYYLNSTLADMKDANNVISELSNLLIAANEYVYLYAAKSKSSQPAELFNTIEVKVQTCRDFLEKNKV